MEKVTLYKYLSVCNDKRFNRAYDIIKENKILIVIKPGIKLHLYIFSIYCRVKNFKKGEIYNESDV